MSVVDSTVSRVTTFVIFQACKHFSDSICCSNVLSLFKSSEEYLEGYCQLGNVVRQTSEASGMVDTVKHDS